MGPSLTLSVRQAPVGMAPSSGRVLVDCFHILTEAAATSAPSRSPEVAVTSPGWRRHRRMTRPATPPVPATAAPASGAASPTVSPSNTTHEYDATRDGPGNAVAPARRYRNSKATVSNNPPAARPPRRRDGEPAVAAQRAVGQRPLQPALVRPALVRRLEFVPPVRRLPTRTPSPPRLAAPPSVGPTPGPGRRDHRHRSTGTTRSPVSTGATQGDQRSRGPGAFVLHQPNSRSGPGGREPGRVRTAADGCERMAAQQLRRSRS